MRSRRIACLLLFGAFFHGLQAPNATAQPIIEDLRPPGGVIETTPTAGIDVLLQEIIELEDLQSGLLPVFTGSVNSNSEQEVLDSARLQAENYIDACAAMLVTAALQLGGTQDDPPSAIPLTTLMLGQIGYVNTICIPLELDSETLYSSIMLDTRFNDIPSDIQAAMIGRYVQELLLRTNLSTDESNALSVVDNDRFISSLSELTGTEAGNTDIYAIDWSTLEDETVWIRYYDEQLRLVEQTVNGPGYDHRFGVILPSDEEGESDVRINLSRIETVIIRENQTAGQIE